jgi:hypothetical protein
MKTLGVGAGFAAGMGLLNENEAVADLRVRNDAPPGKLAQGLETPPCRLEDGKIIRPQSPIPKISETNKQH